MDRRFKFSKIPSLLGKTRGGEGGRSNIVSHWEFILLWEGLRYVIVAVRREGERGWNGRIVGAAWIITRTSVRVVFSVGSVGRCLERSSIVPQNIKRGSVFIRLLF